MVKNWFSLQRSGTWLYFGLVGSVIFFLLRPQFDLRYGAGLRISPEALEKKSESMLKNIGLSTDSMSILILRQYALSFIEDSVNDGNMSIHNARNKYPIAVWQVAFTPSTDQVKSNDFQNNFQKVISGNYGNRFKIDDQFRMLEWISADSTSTLFQVQTTRLDSAISSFARRINTAWPEIKFNHEPIRDLKKTATSDTFVNVSWHNGEHGFIARLHKPDSSSLALVRFSLNGVSYVENSSSDRSSFSLAKFLGGFLSILLFLVSLIWALVICLRRQAFYWPRFFAAGGISLISMAVWLFTFWITVYLSVVDRQGTVQLLVGVLFQIVFTSLLMGLIYTLWESLAREQNHPGFAQIDAAWQLNLFFKETGNAIIYGFGYAGILLALLAISSSALGLGLIFSDSQYRHGELYQWYPALSIPLNATLTAAFVVFGCLGLWISLLHRWLTNHILILIFVAIVGAFSIPLFSSYMLIPGGWWWSFPFFTLAALLTYFGYRHNGVFSVLVTWTVFGIIVAGMQFFTAHPEADYQHTSLGILAVLAGMLSTGIIARWKGSSTNTFQLSKPEYEIKLAEQVRIQNEIKIASESQFDLMPQKSPIIEGAEVVGFYIPSYEVGGDFYNFEVRDDGNLAIVLADVSGKAMKAAMHAVYTSGLFASRILEDSPGELLTSVNPMVYKRTDKKTFITAQMALIDPAKKTMLLSNAGHCRPILKRGNRAQFLHTNGASWPLGVRPNTPYINSAFDLASGDFILFYSDGFPESETDHNIRYGFDHLLEFVRTLDCQDSVGVIAKTIKQEIQNFTGYHLEDDTTVVALKIK